MGEEPAAHRTQNDYRDPWAFWHRQRSRH